MLQGNNSPFPRELIEKQVESVCCSLLSTLRSESCWEGGGVGFCACLKIGPARVGFGAAQTVGKLLEDGTEGAGPLRHLTAEKPKTIQ